MRWLIDLWTSGLWIGVDERREYDIKDAGISWEFSECWKFSAFWNIIVWMMNSSNISEDCNALFQCSAWGSRRCCLPLAERVEPRRVRFSLLLVISLRVLIFFDHVYSAEQTDLVESSSELKTKLNNLSIEPRTNPYDVWVQPMAHRAPKLIWRWAELLEN